MSKKKPEIYLSLDVETDGPAPGLNNMLTIGAAGYSLDGSLLDSFYERIIPLPDLQQNPETMLWWRNQDPKAYFEAFDEDQPGVLAGPASKDRITAFDAMLRFNAWLNHLAIQLEAEEIRITPMAWPAAFDHPFVNYYCHRFLRKALVGYDCLDIRSHVMGLLRKRGYKDVREEEINNMFGALDRSSKRPHVAVDDAIAQGDLFFHIRNSPWASEGLIKSEP